MACADASQRSEAMPVVCTRRDFFVPNGSTVSTSAPAACRCRYQSLTAGGMICGHTSFSYRPTRGQPPSCTALALASAAPPSRRPVVSVTGLPLHGGCALAQQRLRDGLGTQSPRCHTDGAASPPVDPA